MGLVLANAFEILLGCFHAVLQGDVVRVVRDGDLFDKPLFVDHSGDKA